MKRSSNLTLLICCLCFQSANGRESDWFQKRNLQLDQALAVQETDRRIPALGDFVRIGLYGMDEERRMIFDRAQVNLISIPGHARFYQAQIEETRMLVKEHAKLSKDEQFRMQSEESWVGLGRYEDVRQEAFNILGLLPSPETVAVLGHFLEDPEGRDGNDMFGKPRPPLGDAPNCGKAYIAISNLGIEYSPSRAATKRLGDVDYDLDRVDKWKDWWAEVKAGKRTYRFKGSAIEYGPDGPATRQQLERIAKDRKRAEELQKRGHGQSSKTADGTPAAPPLWAMIVAGLAVMGSLVWYFRRGRQGSRLRESA